MKKVIKPWGYELWIADGVQQPYALKRILFKAGKRTSLQVHKYKFETNYVLSGEGLLYISNEKFDIDDFLSKDKNYLDVDSYEKTFKKINLTSGTIFHVEPGFVHRVEAYTDLEFIEASTCELDDVVRLQDDQGRTHGKIDQEHQ